MKNVRMLIAVFVIAISGCGTNPTDINYVQSLTARADAEAPQCENRAECDALWASATKWISENKEASAVKIGASNMSALLLRDGCLFKLDAALAGFGIRSGIKSMPNGFIILRTCSPSLGQHMRTEFHRAITLPPQSAEARR